MTSPAQRRHLHIGWRTTFGAPGVDISISDRGRHSNSGRQHLHDGWRTTFWVKEDDLPNTRGNTPANGRRCPKRTRESYSCPYKMTFRLRSLSQPQGKDDFDKSKYDLTSGPKSDSVVIRSKLWAEHSGRCVTSPKAPFSLSVWALIHSET